LLVFLEIGPGILPHTTKKGYMGFCVRFVLIVAELLDSHAFRSAVIDALKLLNASSRPVVSDIISSPDILVMS